MATPQRETLAGKVKNMSRAETMKKEKSAMDWYINRIKTARGGSTLVKKHGKKIGRTTRASMFMDIDGDFIYEKHAIFIGGMFQYVYDAKTKEDLPYWDAFPLVIPFNTTENGFIGLNLHYLPKLLRAQMLDKLMEYAKYKKTGSNGQRVYMELSYSMLKRLSELPYLQHCVKRYLWTHVRSKVIRIDAEFWEEVAMLPTQQFKVNNTATTTRQVWADARKTTRKKKRR